MRLARILGYATATIKHPSLNGQRLLLAQTIGPEGEPDGPPQLVIDPFGAALHQRVVISSDGAESREIVGDPLSPARWNILGIIDPERSLAL
jgi:ethanolamine utilization protein EutN